MNKFVAIALFALVAAVSANDDAELQKETGLLLGKERLFSDYCMSSRAAIVQDLKSRASDASSGIFTAFFGAANEIADETLTVEKSAIAELSKQMTEATGTKVSDEPLPEDQIQALIQEAKKEMQAQGTIGRVVTSTKTAASVIVNAANSALFVRLAHLRSKMNAGVMIKGIFNTCKQVNEYEQKLEADLSAAKESLKSENTEAEIQSFIDTVTVPGLNCYTTKFVSRLNAFCQLFDSASTPFFKMLGISPAVAKAIDEQRA